MISIMSDGGARLFVNAHVIIAKIKTKIDMAPTTKVKYSSNDPYIKKDLNESKVTKFAGR